MPPEWGLRRGLSFLAPNEYICPISLELMSDPVRVAQSAIAYERAPLEQWLSSHPRTDPKTNVTFGAPLTFAADEALLAQILAWRTDGEQIAALEQLAQEQLEEGDELVPAPDPPPTPAPAPARELASADERLHPSPAPALRR